MVLVEQPPFSPRTKGGILVIPSQEEKHPGLVAITLIGGLASLLTQMWKVIDYERKNNGHQFFFFT